MNFAARFFNDIQSRCVTDYLAIAVAISLPWSTSAAAILMTVWLLAFLPTLDLSALRREVATPAGGIPLLLVAWAALGIFWSDSTWAESFAGLRQFHKLLFIPVLLAYFRYSRSGMQVMVGFFVSCIALLALSWVTALWPEIQTWRSEAPGIPVKKHITQSAVFAISAMCLFYLAVEAWKQRIGGFAIIILLIVLAFIGNIMFVATSRAELIIIAVLIILFGAQRLGWKGTLLGVIVSGGIAFVVWNTSEYLRARVNDAVEEVQSYRTDNRITSSGLRLEFWRKSVDFIATAPLIGHGTGSVKQLFEKSAVGKTGAVGAVTTNPHNQILAVAVPLGLVGVTILCVMWFMHLKMFFGAGPVAWFGLVMVVQNILGSLFNAHLFDFTEGWIYVCTVGVLGGISSQNNVIIPTAWSDLKKMFWPPRGSHALS
jgi:O-antigen ligase